MNIFTSVASEESQFGPVKREKKRKHDIFTKKCSWPENDEKKLVIDESQKELTKNEETVSENDERCRWHVGDERYVVVKPFKGELKVHIRQYEKGDNGLFPTNRGIALNLEKWKKLEELYSEEIDQSVAQFRNATEEVDLMQHLGSNYYVSVKRPVARVDIRRWFLPPNASEIKPTRKGISLTFQQWNHVKGAMKLIKQLLTKELDEIVYCEYSNDHQNQMGFFTCANCNPNDYMNYLGY